MLEPPQIRYGLVCSFLLIIRETVNAQADQRCAWFAQRHHKHLCETRHLRRAPYHLFGGKLRFCVVL